MYCQIDEEDRRSRNHDKRARNSNQRSNKVAHDKVKSNNKADVIAKGEYKGPYRQGKTRFLMNDPTNTSAPLPNNMEVCTMCDESIDTSMLNILPCGCAFHRDCICEWAEGDSPLWNKCPECLMPYRKADAITPATPQTTNVDLHQVSEEATTREVKKNMEEGGNGTRIP